MRTLTPEAATKLLAVLPTPTRAHEVTYTYAREARGSTPPYHLSCSACGDLGWHRATLPTLIDFARAAHGLAPRLAPHRTPNLALAPRPQWFTPSSLPNAPTARTVADPGPHASPALPPCALDADSTYAQVLTWITEGD